MQHPASVAPAALARAAVLDLPVYAGAESPCAVDVSDNTNLWGSPPSALAAIRDAAREGAGEVARYPRAYSSELVSRLLAHHGFTRMDGVNVVVGCGSDDVLDAAMRAFSVDGARIAYSVPTFSMISTFARLSGLTAVEIPLRQSGLIPYCPWVIFAPNFLAKSGSNRPWAMFRRLFKKAQHRLERKYYRQRLDLMNYDKQRKEMLQDLGADPFVD